MSRAIHAAEFLPTTKTLDPLTVARRSYFHNILINPFVSGNAFIDIEEVKIGSPFTASARMIEISNWFTVRGKMTAQSLHFVCAKMRARVRARIPRRVSGELVPHRRARAGKSFLVPGRQQTRRTFQTLPTGWSSARCKRFPVCARCAMGEPVDAGARGSTRRELFTFIRPRNRCHTGEIVLLKSTVCAIDQHRCNAPQGELSKYDRHWRRTHGEPDSIRFDLAADVNTVVSRKVGRIERLPCLDVWFCREKPADHKGVGWIERQLNRLVNERNKGLWDLGE